MGSQRGDTLLAAAFKLATLGYSVVPSGGGATGKAPLVAWAECQKSRATEEEILSWDNALHPTLWGVVTGAVSGAVVVDADTAKRKAELERDGLRAHVLTPRGGAHFWVKHPGFPVKTIAGVLPGVDVRGDGGFANCLGAGKDGAYSMVTVPTPDTLNAWEKIPEDIRRAASPATQAKRAAPLPDRLTEGHRNSALISLAGSMRRRNASEGAIYAALVQLNAERCDPPLKEAEVHRIAMSARRYDSATSGNGHGSQPEKQLSETVPLVCLDTVEAEAVKWLWRPYIPFGKLTLLEGDPGCGKSWLALAIATAVSLNRGLPKVESLTGGYVLLASAEDGLADTIRPRLDAMNADVSMIHAIDGLFTLDDAGFGLLEEYIKKIVPAFIVVDPLVAYLSGDVDINRANMVRQATSRLAKLAETYGPAVLAVRHLTKGISSKPMYRGLGSIDFTASARSVLLAGVDPDAPEKRGFCHLKCNLASLGEAVGYELREGGFHWSESTELTAEKILAADTGDGGSALQDAKDFLTERLTATDVAAKDIFDEAAACGIKEKTLRRAKKELQVEAYSKGEAGKRGAGQWFWKLPQGDETK